MMEYRTRAENRLLSPKRGFHTIAPPKIMFVHHAAGWRGGSSEAVREIQSTHQDDRGWNDIAYNWLVDDQGTIHEGRGWFNAGGATKGWNTVSHAVCYIGNAEVQAPTQAALRGINTVINEANRLRAGQDVRKHKDVVNTACPGKYLVAWIDHGRPTIKETPDMTWQDEVAFLLGVEQKYRYTGPNYREATSEDMSYYRARFKAGDDPQWLLDAIEAGLRSEKKK